MTKDTPFCSRPFRELMLSYEGKVHPCCLLEDFELGDIKDMNLNEFWNCEKLQKLREEFLSGNIKTCSKNIATKSCHKFYDKFNDEVEKKIIQSGPIKKLDLRLNGKCNLECIMCHVWMGENGKYDDTSFWKEGPSEVFPHIQEIDMLGGEPFIQSDTFKLIDEVSKVNKECKWNFTTNANWNFAGKIKTYLDKITIGVITISIDAILPDTYFRIRRKGDFKQILKTIDDLITYRNTDKPGMYLRLDFVVQTQNLLEVLPFYHFCLKKDLDPSFILLEEPAELSISNLDTKSLKKVLLEIEPHINEPKAVALKTIHRNITEILSKRGA